MISNQIIREALVRLKRSGKRHIFLSEKSQSRIKNIHVQAKPELVEPEKAETQVEEPKELVTQLDKLALTKDSKSENLIVLKEALAKLYPNETLLFGKGSLDPKILFLSEYPSAEEFQNNSLCVGKANDLMEKIVKAMGINQEDVYFTSIIKSKGLSATVLQKGKNSPESKGIKVFIEYFKKELSVLNPAIIISLGELAHSLLMEQNLKKEEFNSIRGQLFKFEDYPMVSTFNPNYLLFKDSLETKRLFWEDLLLVMGELKLEISEKQKNYFKQQ